MVKNSGAILFLNIHLIALSKSSVIFGFLVEVH